MSLNKAFKKVPRSEFEPGKGMFWTIDNANSHLLDRGKGYKKKMRSNLSFNSAPSTPPPPQRNNSFPIAGSTFTYRIPIAQVGSKAISDDESKAKIPGINSLLLPPTTSDMNSTIIFQS